MQMETAASEAGDIPATALVQNYIDLHRITVGKTAFYDTELRYLVLFYY